MFSGQSFGLEILGWLTTVFIFVIGLFILFLLGAYISDITQTKQAIRRNHHVIGHFQYHFDHIGTFFRQYFFTMPSINEAKNSHLISSPSTMPVLAHSFGVLTPRELNHHDKDDTHTNIKSNLKY